MATTHDVKKPTAFDKVYRDECMFGFDTPESDEGLFLNLKTHQSFGADFVDLDRERTGQTTYLHMKWTRVPKATEDGEAAEPAAVTTFAIGVEGGFQTEDSKWEYKKDYQIARFPGPTFSPYPAEDCPAEVAEAVEAVLNHTDAAVEDSATAWVDTYEVSTFALDLVQLDNGKRISPNPSTWQCELCDLKENLWMNLSDGFIGCGRVQPDGSGGRGHALQHFNDTGGIYPLCVKLGTVTPKGGDVYSYAPSENDMVEDPNLGKHLEHWGINMMKMEKTERTMAEVNIDANQQFEFNTILETESGKPLVPRYGPGFVGLKNLGNSCYMNSVMQVLFTLPEFRARFFDPAAAIFKTSPANPADDLVSQMAKVAVGLLSDKYVHPPPAEGETRKDDEIAPARLRAVLGKGHPEFSTGGQQDAAEYLTHVLERLSRAERTATDPGHAVGDVSQFFSFTSQQKLTCGQSGKVRYQTTTDNALLLSIPLEATTNQADVDEYVQRLEASKKRKAADGSASGTEEPPVRAQVPFEACLERYFADSTFADFMSPATGTKGTATRNTRLATMPRYLTIKLARYVLGDDWTPKKLDAIVPMPTELDLEKFRGTGLQAGEEELPADAAPAAASAAAPEASPEIVSALTGMGFSDNAAKRAALATSNANAEVASNWLFAHMEDPDINDPLPAPGASGSAAGDAELNPESVVMLSSMGFSEAVAKQALRETGGDVGRAADWVFSHTDDIPAIEAGTYGAGGSAGGAGGAAEESKADDGPGSYELFAFVSHMGRNTGSGHYVCHVKKDGKWTLFNDSKVAFSESPPFGHGFVYFYRRKA